MDKQESKILKGMAILAMLYHHLFYDTKTFSAFPLIAARSILTGSQLHTIGLFCKICVPIFVFVSSYGLTRQYMEKGILQKRETVARDALNRYVKLLLGVWCIYAAALIMSQILGKHTFGQVFLKDGVSSGVKYFILDLAGLAKLTETPTFNSTWWYLSLAVILFILMPLLNMLYDKTGVLIITFALVLPVIMDPQNSVAQYLLRYLPGIAIAICAARGNWLEIWKKRVFSVSRKITAAVILTAGMLLLYYFKTRSILPNFLAENLFTLNLVLLVTALSKLRFLYPLQKILETFGQHSTNMFLVHSFIKSYFFKEWTYSFQYPWLIFLVLVSESFAVSFVLERVKTVCGFYRIQDGLTRRIMN